MSRKERKPLAKVTCTSTDCDEDLHCFRQAKKRGEEHVQGGRCRDCGADLVDFTRVHKRDHADVKYTWSSLKYELIRHHFWHLDIDIKAVNYARRKGKVGMRGASENRIRNPSALLNLPSMAGKPEKAAILFTMLNTQPPLVAASVLSIGTEFRSTKLSARNRFSTLPSC